MMPVVIIGASGHAKAAIDALRRSSRAAAIDGAHAELPPEVSGVPLLGGDERSKELDVESVEITNGVWSGGIRPDVSAASINKTGIRVRPRRPPLSAVGATGRRPVRGCACVRRHDSPARSGWWG